MKTKRIIMSLLAALSCVTALAGETTSLDGQWTLDFWPQGRTAVLGPGQMDGIAFQTIPATVPGNVELDLYAAGLAPKPETGSNVHILRTYEGYQWRYSRTFATPEFGPEDSVMLNFEGVDCYAEVYVNGEHVGSTDNMLIPHCFDVTDVLAPAGRDNKVEVYIRSSVVEARRRVPPTFSNNWSRPETVFTRRAPHSYGWDIMPRLVSAGLWKSVSVEVLPPVHLMDVHWMTSRVDVDRKTAYVLLDYALTFPPKYQQGDVVSHVRISRNGKTVWESTSTVAMYSERKKIDLSDVDFWWPRGYGEPALYDAEVTLTDKEGRVLDSDRRRIGIRTIRLDNTETHTDAEPGRFCFVVNGEPVFIHGSNWTPLDALHSRDPQWVGRAVDLAVDLNCNMLRCWGGNVYESDEFYDLCDANGIMIWQDFTMGCSFYPLGIEFQLALEKELDSVVRRLRSHPCIALWAGNNEDDEMMADGNFSSFKPDPNRDRVSRVTIPNALFELDPTRDYLPSSPWWSPKLVAEHYSTDAMPERHLWGPRGYYKDPFYTTEAKCLFASETGYHGMPNRESLEKMFPPESVYPWEEGSDFKWKWDWITKAVTEYGEWGYRPSRNNLMINQVKILFGDVPTDLDLFIEASQDVQAEAMKFFVERFRGAKFAPRTGILWWNVRDGWPIISDAVVDWYFSPKKAFFYIKNVQHNVCAMILDAENGSHPLVVANDTRHPASGKITVKDVASGKTVWKGRYDVEANGRQVVAGIPEKTGRQGVFLITYTGEDGTELRNHYLYGEPPFALDSYRDWMKKTEIY